MISDAARLEITDVTVERSGARVLSNVSMVARGGRALVLRGPNGAGKTTLIRAVAGLLKPLGGEIRLVVPGAAGTEASVGEQAHLVGHGNALKARLTVRENLAFWQHFLGGRPDLVPQALTALDLEPLADIPAGLLSAGQKRRAGLARLIVAPRLIWLLDEPSTSLDAASTTRVERIVMAHVAGGGIAIVTTHLPLALGDCDVVELAGRRQHPAPDVAMSSR